MNLLTVCLCLCNGSFPHLPFCSEALLADLAVLWVFRVVDFQVKPQGPQLLEALVTLAAVEALLLCVHLKQTEISFSWKGRVATHLLLVLGQATLVCEGLVAVETSQQVVLGVAPKGFRVQEGFRAELAGEKVPGR